MCTAKALKPRSLSPKFDRAAGAYRPGAELLLEAVSTACGRSNLVIQLPTGFINEGETPQGSAVQELNNKDGKYYILILFTILIILQTNSFNYNNPYNN